MNRPEIYLAGQISGLNWQNSISWRDIVSTELAKFGIHSFSPLRAKSYLRPYSNNDGVIDGTYEQHVLSSQRGIFGRDYFDCITRDLIFVNYLGATERSLGTAMEIAWAYHADKPIVVAIEDEGNPNDHAMIMEACRFRVNSLEEAIWCTSVILNPVQHNHYSFEESK
jgi:hypothetical protein